MGSFLLAMKLTVLFTVGLALLVSTWAVSSETESYAGMAALESETQEWQPPATDAKASLGESQGSKGVPSAEQTAFDSDADANNPTSLFPGVPYGKPGYKESHDWVNDVDYFSPLVFDWKYYKARCSAAASCKDQDGNDGEALGDMNEEQVKNYWLEHGMERCDVASPTFNAPFYVQSNEELWEDLRDGSTEKPLCKKAVKQFLTKGVFDGLSGTSYDGLVVTDGPEDKTHWKATGQKCLEGCNTGAIKWDTNYAWTFWYMRSASRYHKVQPVFSVRRHPRHHWDGWWGGYPFFVSWLGSMMFCASSDRWECHWPIGEENSGVKGGWRFNWYHRWRLPPVNWWRFYGVMSDEDGYTLYEFSDPPIENNNNMNQPRKNGLEYTVHGFSRRIPTKAAGSWWGWDIHKPYSRPDNLWFPSISSSAGEVLPETCARDDNCHPYCYERGWHSNYKCRLASTVEECGYCKEHDGKIMRSRDSGNFRCRCKKKWDEIDPIPRKPFTDNDAVIWTGYTYSPWILNRWGHHCGWMTHVGEQTPQYIMDLTYYRLGDHTFSEEEMKAIYLKGRSIDSITGNEKPSNRY